MSTVDQAFSGNPILRTSLSGVQVAEALVTIVGIIGLIGVLRVIIPKLHSTSTILVFNLCLADLIFDSNESISHWISIFTGHWLSKEHCIINALGNVIGAATVMGSLMGIAVERYLSICRNITISSNVAWYYILVFWSIATSCTVFAYFTHAESLQIVAGKEYCNIAFFSRSVPALFLSVIAVILITSTCFTLSFCYISIFFKYYYRSKNVRTHRTGHNLLSPNEWIVLKKCAMLSFSFAIFWLPMLIAILVEIGTGKPSSAYLSGIAGLLSTLHAVLDPYMMIYFDAKVRADIYYLLGVENTKIVVAIERSMRKQTMDPVSINQEVSIGSLPGASIKSIASSSRVPAEKHTRTRSTEKISRGVY